MIEWAITSSVLILVVLALRRCLVGRMSLRLQYGLWALVLVRLLLPVSLGTAAWSVLNLTAPMLGAEEPAEQSRPQNGEPVTPELSVVVPDDTVDPQLSIAEPDTSVTPKLPQVESGVAADPRARQSMTGVERGLTALWAAGAVGLGLWFVWVNVRFAGRLRRSRAPLCVENCPLPVYVTGAVQTPCLFGLFRPGIYVTEEAAADGTVLRHSLAHELTHYRHGDPIWAALRGLCLVLHWYNPLVWLAASLSQRDGELCCDEATVRYLGEGERAAYGRTLLAVTCQGHPNPLLTATSMTGSGKGIKERIVLLAKRPRTAVYTLAAVVLIAAVAVGCTFTGARESNGEISINLAEGIEVPQAVSDYAREYVKEQLDFDTENNGYAITRAEIVGLTAVNTGAAARNSGVSLFLLEYRFAVADPEHIALMDGMTIEDGSITEWGSDGQPYLLFCWEDMDDEKDWKPVCVTHTDRIIQDYGTPEMLENYEDAYTAAAVELYLRFQGENSMDESFYQLLSDWYRVRYPNERWYFQAEQPDQPREGDICLGPVGYQGGGVYINESTGEVYVVEVSRYEDGQFRALPDPHTLVLQRGQDGALQGVLGALEHDTSTMTTEDIVWNVALGLLDADVSLRRDGYPLPIGPGAWAELFYPIYDGEPEVQVMADYEPVYDQGDYWDKWSVEGFSALRYYSASEGEWSANTIDVTRTDLYTPRGIRVGDSRAKVLEAYPEALTGDYWGKYPEETDLLAYVAWNPHAPGEISDLSQLEFYEGLGPAILFFFDGDTLRQITLTNMFN